MKNTSMKIFIGGLLSVFLLLSVCCFAYAQDMTDATEANVPANAAAHSFLGVGWRF